MSGNTAITHILYFKLVLTTIVYMSILIVFQDTNKFTESRVRIMFYYTLIVFEASDTYIVWAGSYTNHGIGTHDLAVVCQRSSRVQLWCVTYCHPVSLPWKPMLQYMAYLWELTQNCGCCCRRKSEHCNPPFPLIHTTVTNTLCSFKRPYVIKLPRVQRWNDILQWDQPSHHSIKNNILHFRYNLWGQSKIEVLGNSCKHNQWIVMILIKIPWLVKYQLWKMAPNNSSYRSRKSTANDHHNVTVSHESLSSEQN